MTSYERSKAFYVDRLGFQIDWEHRFKPDFPVFMQVSRDGLAFFLTEHKGDCPVGGLIHLYVPDVDAWYAEFQSKGVPVQEPPNESLQGRGKQNSSKERAAELYEISLQMRQFRVFPYQKRQHWPVR